MTPPQWILEYVKRGFERAVKEAAKKVAEAAVAEPKPKKKKKASKPERDDHASDAQVQETKRKLMVEEGFTKVVLPAHGTAYFSQGDKRWAKMPFPKWKKNPATGKREPVYEFAVKDKKTGEIHMETRTLRGGGCGPTSLAIAIATLRPDIGLTPTDVAEFAIEKKYSGNYESNGANMKMVDPLTEKYGLESVTIEKKDPHKIDKLREGLDNGGVAVVHVGHGVFNYKSDPDEKEPHGGHFIAVTGYAVDKDGKEWFFVANPGKDGSAKTVEDKELIVDRSLEHHGAGMVRVSRENLEKLMKESYMVTDPKAAAPAD